jgi:DNA topoisomerase IA
MSLIQTKGRILLPQFKNRAFTVIKYNEPHTDWNPPLAFLTKSLQGDSILRFTRPARKDMQKDSVCIPLYPHVNQDGSLVAIDFDKLREDT